MAAEWRPVNASGGPAVLRNWPSFDGSAGIGLKLQVAGASALFARLRVYYVPRLLVRYLTRYDIVFALQSFFDRLGLSYEVLTAPTSAAFEHQRELLDYWVGILVTAEEATRGTGLQYAAIENLVGADGEQVSQLLERLERAGTLWRKVHSLDVRWPQYTEFVAKADGVVAEWESLEDLDFLGIDSAADGFLDMHRRILLVRDRFDSLRFKLRTSTPGRSERANRIAESISDRFRAINASVDAGEDDPLAILPQLEELLNDMDEALGVGVEWSQEERERKERALAAALAFMGFKDQPDDDTIRKRYRELAKLWHPDHNKMVGASERFQALGNHYEIVRDFMARRQNRVYS